MNYKEQLADPRWQKKRLQILERDKFTCQICHDAETQLQVHHIKYDPTFKSLAWEYPPHNYKTLCKDCHKALTEHLKEHGDDKEFNVLKIKDGKGNNFCFIYTNGILKFDVSGFDGYLNLTENTTHSVVQFLINNWLKNG